MKIIKKFSLIFLAAILIMSGLCNIVNAASNGNFNLTAFDTPPTNGVNETNKIVNQTAASVIGLARIVCVTIAIVILLVIAMKYMISAPGDRADIKKHSVNYVIGAFVLFGITGILTVINNLAQTIGK